MVDYRVSDGPEALLPKRGGPFKMEELALMALLKCPLCFEQLDVSAKVLPCQHTFCVSCLQKQEAAHSQLLCPECRAPVPVRLVQELPVNVLLVRLLEGLQGSVGPGKDRQAAARYATPFARDLGLAVREGQQQRETQHREKQGHSERGNSSGELVPAPGNGITSKHKVDESWHRGNSGDSSGASVTASAMQAASQMPQLQPLQQSQPPALCRALYDFNPEEMNFHIGGPVIADKPRTSLFKGAEGPVPKAEAGLPADRASVCAILGAASHQLSPLAPLFHREIQLPTNLARELTKVAFCSR